MNYLCVTTRQGEPIHEEYSEHSLYPIEQKLLAKYGKDKVFLFRAPPSNPVSTGPSRMPPPSRKFRMAD